MAEPVARDSALLGKVARIFFEAIRDHLRGVSGGVFLCAEAGSIPRFVAMPAPSRAKLAEVLCDVAERVSRIHAVREDDGLDAQRAAAMARGTVARLPLGDALSTEDARFEARRTGVEHAGYNVHVRVRVGAEDRIALERLCRYVARPAVCGERVEALEDGRVA